MTRRTMLAFALLAALAAVLAMRGRQVATQARASVVDSVVPRPVALARFREGLPRVDTLAGGAASREALVRAFMAALGRRDTAALLQLTMSKAEFGWLYYETTPQGMPPYDLMPSLLWFLTEGHTSQGLSKLLQERGGLALRYAGHTCDTVFSVEGANRVYGPCDVRVNVNGRPGGERLFGPIIERGGRFKFVSLANRL